MTVDELRKILAPIQGDLEVFFDDGSHWSVNDVDVERHPSEPTGPYVVVLS